MNPSSKSFTGRTVRMRILVADDNHDVAQSMAMLLELFGHEVHIAHDGLEAVDAVERLQPELVFMDVGMPRLSGYEATRRIRAQPGGDRIVIAALTGWGQERDRRESREAGCDLHLVKPVDPSALEQLLESAQRGELRRAAAIRVAANAGATGERAAEAHTRQRTSG